MRHHEHTRAYLVRHGETEWNQDRPGYCGWSDIPLNEKGRAQANALACRFDGEGVAVVLSSDLARARDTASAIAVHSRNAAPQVDARFRELNYGVWEGKSPEEVWCEYPDQFAAWKEDPVAVPAGGAETLAQVVDRAAPALQAWVDRYRGQSIVLVAHKTTVRLLICWALGLPLKEYTRILQQNGAVNLLEFRGKQAHLALCNDVCHLPGDLCSPAM